MGFLCSSRDEFIDAHGHRRSRDHKPGRIRRAIDGGFNWFRGGPFRQLVTFAFQWRYSLIALMITSLIISVGALAGGRVKFVFFPNLESENALASIYFAPGVPRPEQVKAVIQIEAALFKVEKELLSKAKANPETGKKDEKIVEASFALLGSAGRSSGNNLAEINAQLTPSEARNIRTKAVLNAWRKAVPQIPGIERITIFGRRGGPPGRDVDVRLQNGPVEVLKKAAEELKDRLTAIAGASAIGDDLPYGKQELVFSLTPRGTALGFTGSSVGRQVRNAFEGAIATRFARGDEEITVRVLREQENTGLAALQSMYLRTPTGARVPLMDVVEISERQTFSVVQRREGIRTVAVTADLDDTITTPTDVVAQLERDVMPQLALKYGITYVYSGKDEERGKAFADLGSGSMLAFALIYIILAWVFSSYGTPLAVMAIIPFGFVGAIAGHYVMGYNLTLPSLIGLLGLSGILVNDSIVLVSRLQERLRLGESLESASINAACDRLRAVLLTSLTTVGGLTPLIFETSRQAQFLIPLAITIVFGLATATLIVLVLVPCLIGLGHDVGRIGRAIIGLYIRPKTDPEPAGPGLPAVRS